MSRRVRAIYFGIWAVITIACYALLDVVPSLLKAVWFAVLYLILTLPSRSLRAGSFALLVFGGLLVISHFTLLLQLLVSNFLPPEYKNVGEFAHVVLLAAISEETVKLLALALMLVIWRRTGAFVAVGATDQMLAGLALGTGLGLFDLKTCSCQMHGA